MAAPDPYGPDVGAIEHELARGQGGMSAGHVVIDLLFGIAAPIALLRFDLGVFRPIYSLAPALPAYWAKVAYVAAGCLIALLVLWVVTGARRQALGLLVAGPFAVGAVLILFLAFHLFVLAFNAMPHLSGIVAWTPWVTAYVYGRHALRALRRSADLSAPLAGIALVVLGGVSLAALGIAGNARGGRVPLLLDQLLSRNEADADYAADRMLQTGLYDSERILAEYARLAKTDPRRERVGQVYEMLTSELLSRGLRRAGVEPDDPPQPGTRPPAPPATTREP